MSQRTIWRPWRRTLLATGKRIAWVLQRTPCSQVVSTAGIERLNATFRERCAPLARRTRHLARQVATIHTPMDRVGTVYTVCTVHRSIGVTPAMAAGITDHQWSVGDLLAYRIPPRGPFGWLAAAAPPRTASEGDPGAGGTVVSLTTTVGTPTRYVGHRKKIVK